MFTGIVEQVGAVVRVSSTGGGRRLTIDGDLIAGSARIGDSVAVNGACLTVVAVQGSTMEFDAVPETVARTNLGAVRAGDLVNLERALSLGQRLDGHLVQGHVDGTGTLESILPRDNAHVVRVRIPRDLMRYVVEKGSVALDGISLTVAELYDQGCLVWIIPHTWQHTTLRRRAAGDVVNIEVDLLARYVERLLQPHGESPGLSRERLTAAGFDA